MFFTSFLLVFLAEIADKTQFLLLALSQRYSLRSILFGMGFACVWLNFLSIFAASWLHHYLSVQDIQWIAAVVFLIFGFHSLKIANKEEKKERKLRFIWLSVAIAFFIAELGDKTQLSTITLAAQSNEKAAIFCGSFLGLFLSNLFALTIGKVLLSHISASSLRLLSAVVFFGYGSWSLFRLYPMSQLQIVCYCLFLFTAAFFYSLWQERKAS